MASASILRDILPSPEAAAHAGRVAAALRQAITTAGGWIPFSQYMQIALYAPGLGYYAAGATKFGGAGDFITAPELSPLFAQCIATQVADVLAETGGDILELGPGTGALAAEVLKTLDASGRLPGRYQLLDLSPDLRSRQRDRIAAEVPHLVARCEWIDALPAAFTGVILANEVLDAVPVHLAAWTDNGLCERGVTATDGAFAWADRPLDDDSVRAGLAGIDVPAPYVSEVSPDAIALARTLATRLMRGAAFLVDYGFGRREYYHPQRSRGTLMCHYRHRAHDDPFFLPGLQDITAHVDFTAVAEAAVAVGAGHGGYTTQAQFLINCGIAERLQRLHGAVSDADYARLAAGAQKLLSPAEMGELFKVAAFARNISLPMRGFATGDLTRLL